MGTRVHRCTSREVPRISIEAGAVCIHTYREIGYFNDENLQESHQNRFGASCADRKRRGGSGRYPIGADRGPQRGWDHWNGREQEDIGRACRSRWAVRRGRISAGATNEQRLPSSACQRRRCLLRQIGDVGKVTGISARVQRNELASYTAKKTKLIGKISLWFTDGSVYHADVPMGMGLDGFTGVLQRHGVVAAIV